MSDRNQQETRRFAPSRGSGAADRGAKHWLGSVILGVGGGLLASFLHGTVAAPRARDAQANTSRATSESPGQSTLREIRYVDNPSAQQRLTELEQRVAATEASATRSAPREETSDRDVEGQKLLYRQRHDTLLQ